MATDIYETARGSPDWSKLLDHVRWSRKKLEPFRDFRVNVLRQLAGLHYSDYSAETRVPHNLLELALTIYLTQLAARDPRVLITSPVESLQGQAWNFELAVEQRIKDMELGDTLRAVVLDALVLVGYVKVGLTYDDMGGESFVERIDPDDLIVDMAAGSGQPAFVGNYYRVPTEDALDWPMMTEQGRKRLRNMQDDAQEPNEQEEAKDIAKGTDVPDEYIPHTTFLDLWLPRTNQLCTFIEKLEGEPVATVDWDGPIGGPYRQLAFFPLPDSAMPLSPCHVWYDKHLFVNQAYRKLMRQAERQKKILGYESSAVDDGSRIEDANDGDIVKIRNRNGIGEIPFGGLDPQTLAFAVHMKDSFKADAGNLDVLAGLGPQSSTATQDQLINLNANRRLSAMQGKVIKFTREICRDLAWYEWTDPLRRRMVERRDEESGESLAVEWSARTRRGRFINYNFDISPYSMQDESPSTKLQMLQQIMQGLVIPLAPLLAQQGIQVDLQHALHLYARYSQFDDLEKILKPLGESNNPYPQPVQGERPKQSPATTRTNVRVNQPAQTPQTQDQQMMQSLLANASQAQPGTAA